MTYLLTAAAAGAAAAAAAGPAGWIVLAVVGGVLATAATIAAVKEIKENKDEIKNKKEILDNLDKELEEINREFTVYDKATAASDRLDQGERDYLNDLANSNAEAYAKKEQAYEYATAATERLDQGERTYLNDLANSNAEINNKINTPAEEKPKEEAPGNSIVTDVPKTETETGNEENQNKDNQPVVGGDVSDLLDGTGENEETKIENAMSYQDFVTWWEEQQQKAWDREDSIRKEIEKREDTAYQRAVADMRKAGINPNLLGVNPAESGGGITQATIPDMSVLTSEMKVSAEKLQQLIDQEFEGDQATKDRILDAFTSVLSSVGMFLTFKKFK